MILKHGSFFVKLISVCTLEIKYIIYQYIPVIFWRGHHGFILHCFIILASSCVSLINYLIVFFLLQYWFSSSSHNLFDAKLPILMGKGCHLTSARWPSSSYINPPIKLTLKLLRIFWSFGFSNVWSMLLSDLVIGFAFLH